MARMRPAVLLLLLCCSFLLPGLPGSAAGEPSLRGRAVWSSPRDAGTTEASVRAFVEFQQQKTWARDFPHLWIGVAAYQLYDEERAPLTQLRGLLSRNAPASDLKAPFDKIAPRLKTFAPDLHDAIAAHLRTPGLSEDLAKRVGAFLASPPAGYYPPEKLTATLERVRAEGVEGVVVFSTGGVSSAQLWETLGAFFAK